MTNHTLEGRPVRGLTLHRPWPFAFTHADKRVENRSWKPPDFIIGGWLALHSGKKFDKEAAGRMKAGQFGQPGQTCPQDPDAHPDSVITAVARLRGFYTLDERNPDQVLGPLWHFGPVCWDVREIHVLPDPVPCRGAQGLWRPSQDVLEAIKAQWPGRPPAGGGRRPAAA